jgi:ATP-dependent Clp protease ATP-binding subunit ClpA
MFERFTDGARSVLNLAQEEARLLNHDFIGTEHILLGLVREEGEGDSGVLTSFGISLGSVRSTVQETIGPGAASANRSPPFTPRAKKVLELSLREALALGHHHIGTEHIVLGLLREGEGVAVKVLGDLGVGVVAVRERAIQVLSGPVADEQAETSAHDAPVEPGRLRRRRSAVAASPRPRCPHCHANLEDVARFRTTAVRPDALEGDRDAIEIYVVYCSACGASLYMFTRHPSE